jgi:hypothetical protein
MPAIVLIHQFHVPPSGRCIMSTNPEKKVDVPPRGDRDADPMTDQPGAHPVELGVGAAAAGMAAGAVTGPVGAAVGAAIGAVAGGLAGKGVGEYIDPTIGDTYLRDNYASRPYVRKGDTFDTHVPAYRYGGQAEATYGGKPYESIEEELRTGWTNEDLPWESAAVRDGYERSCAIRKARKA